MGFPLGSRPFVFRGDPASLRRVEEEVLVVLQAGQDTTALLATCYGVAVQTCLRVGEGTFLLRVRPDLRSLLLSQLRDVFPVSRVYGVVGDTARRILLTDKVSIRWASYASGEPVRDALGRYFPALREASEPRDDIYLLAPRYADDPLVVVQALELEPLVIRAAPVVIAFPVPALEDAAVDLLAVG
jgi:hypothetical protein